MSSDYNSDDDGDYYDDDMMDIQEDDGSLMSDDDIEIDTFVDASKNKSKSYDVLHESLSQTAVAKLMQQDIDHICNILGVDSSTAALLLRHLAWNKERLIEAYMDNSCKVLCAAGVTVPEEPSNSAVSPVRGGPTRRSQRGSSSRLVAKKTRSAAPEPVVCQICFDDSPDLQILSLSCEHGFCSNCWSAYITSKVRDEGEHTIRCMAEHCRLVTPDSFIHSVLIPGGPTQMNAAQQDDSMSTWSRFQELLVRHFVASDRSLKYCPYPSCTNTVKCTAATTKSSLSTLVPIVSCGASSPRPGTLMPLKQHTFCFGCPIDSDHRPLICAVAKMWLKKCEDDSETANWIKSNTKECSKCQSTIEKNGGCNHMTCKKCKYEFCWVCMGPWSEHGTAWYSCNRYDEKAGVEARDAQSRSRASLERYLHYYNRWANHEQSAKLSLDLYAKTERKMEDMQVTSSLTWIEVQFMKKAVEEVEKCRQTLKWTYAMAYYLAKGNEKDLFEDNQRDLEKAVEDLSELIEGPLEPENIATLRQQTTDKTVYVQKRNEIVLEDTAAGLIEGRWRWNVEVEGFDDPTSDAI
ncbi:hypothetical protein FISHEDRAFT_32987 [Fistulina hepatica ATCC 64428]|uniref:RBR-type E3 ubiquitin transferase n=1 Tax=Fistulina hepatica ATCC 64428 TaxID=1128425 RepID=A0A0D7APB0_9AGAR|nr:hypothetical protein FISHEDRAFT_32987 [Fistulina hepatica ATCC 64428]